MLLKTINLKEKNNDIQKKISKIKNMDWRQVLLICYLIAIIVISVLLYLSVKNQPQIPYKEIDATNKVVNQIKKDLLESQRRIDDIDKRVREQIKEIRCIEQDSVSTMDSDDIANALQDELRKFRAD